MTEQAENCDNNLTNQKVSLSVPLADDTNPTSIDELPTELVEVIGMNDCNSNSKEQLHSKSHCKSDLLEHKVRCKEEELMGTKKVQGRTEQKTEVNDALNKSKVQKSDLELGINKSKTEEAGLNDGLHQDEKIFPMTVTEHKQALAAEEKGEPYVQVIDTTREKVISCLKADKDVLENSLYEVKEQARQLEVRNEQLIGENQDLIIGKENLQVEITRLRENKDNEKVLFDLKFENLNLRLAQLESNKQMAITQEKQVHKDAVDRLSKEMERIQQLQRAVTSSERDRNVLQEILDSTRQALNDAKKQNYDLLERVQTLQNDCSESEVRRAEVEGQLRQNHGVLVKRTETEQELNQIVQKLTQDKQNMQDHISNISRNLSTVETQKSEMERTYNRLEKDKSALRKALDKVAREKLKTEDIVNTSLVEKGSLDRSLARLEEDNSDLNKQVQQLQAQLAEAERQHAQRLIDVTTRHRAETEMEIEGLRTAQMQAERMLETRERSNRTKIKGLEETVATLKDQLSTETKKRQLYISRSACTGDKIRDIRSILESSLSNVTRDQSLDPLIMETETRKLDESLEFRGSYRSQPRRRTSPNRTPMKYSDRLTSTPAMHRTQSPIALRKKLLK